MKRTCYFTERSTNEVLTVNKFIYSNLIKNKIGNKTPAYFSSSNFLLSHFTCLQWLVSKIRLSRRKAMKQLHLEKKISPIKKKTKLAKNNSWQNKTKDQK